ncbi:hypothetical protein EYF80_010576 [Liparis tanakae]|uniref:Uncharacterized protein n=1 Tax=Liparis tanakae TaxID=230148 RepID=A0A4Z2IN39_9TELE|nr:hypothetical protein EYF80_010576 [Liparis tanakae]
MEVESTIWHFHSSGPSWLRKTDVPEGALRSVSLFWCFMAPAAGGRKPAEEAAAPTSTGGHGRSRSRRSDRSIFN